jgi:sugar transferase EpsL
MFPKGVPLTKRLLDLILTVGGVVILSPVYLLTAGLVWLYHGRPLLFRQQRPGYHAKPFYIYKFRTMTDGRDAQGALLPDSERLTHLGRFLRAASLDELPELFNILIGEMSLVGPRPLLMQYLDRYTPEQARRHDVLPGITGWAQINGRNVLSWDDKFSLDSWYVDHWSFWLDLKILWLTLWKVLKREGINQPGQATAEEFMGSPPDKGGL